MYITVPHLQHASTMFTTMLSTKLCFIRFPGLIIPRVYSRGLLFLDKNLVGINYVALALGFSLCSHYGLLHYGSTLVPHYV